MANARDKPNMLQCIDLLTKIFNSSKEACKWLINYLCTSDSNSGGGAHLCFKLFYKCPNSSICNMFQRMFLLVLNKLIRATDQQENKEIVYKIFSKSYFYFY
jgi:ubiquitin carboxyl-terminal hydrolase 34